MRKDLRTWFAWLFLIGLIACAPTPRPPTPTIERILATPAPYMTETPIAASTPKPTPTSLPLTGAAAAFDVARAREHNRFIAQEIGARLVGSDEDRRAGDYVSDQFGLLGYDVEWQEFTYDVWVNNNTNLQVVEPTKAIWIASRSILVPLEMRKANWLSSKDSVRRLILPRPTRPGASRWFSAEIFHSRKK